MAKLTDRGRALLAAEKAASQQTQPGAVTDYLFRLDCPVVPAPRMNSKTQFVSKRASKYLTIKAQMGWQYRSQMSQNGWPILPADTALYIAFDMTIPRKVVDVRGLHFCDWDNYAKAIQDAANGIVFFDDMLIDQCLGFRRRLGLEWQTLVRVGVLNDPGA